jgi:hypothetical protein
LVVACGEGRFEGSRVDGRILGGFKKVCRVSGVFGRFEEYIWI